MSMAEKYININISIVQRGRQIHEQTQKPMYMYMYMYLRISVPTVQMLLKTNAPVHVKPERQITLISYNYNIHM